MKPTEKGAEEADCLAFWKDLPTKLAKAINKKPADVALPSLPTRYSFWHFRRTASSTGYRSQLKRMAITQRMDLDTIELNA